MKILRDPFPNLVHEVEEEDPIPVSTRTWHQSARELNALRTLGLVAWPGGEIRRGTPDECREAFKKLRS